MHVLQHEHRGAHAVEQLGGGPEHPVARGALVGELRGRRREPVAQLRHERRERAHDRVVVAGSDEVGMVGQDVEHRRERQRLLQLLAVADQHGHPRERRVGGELADEAALADARLAVDDDQGRRVPDLVDQGLQLARAAHQDG